MIYYYGAPTLDKYPQQRWEEFICWVKELREVELDIETTVTPYWCTRSIMTVQFGNIDTQWVLQWTALADAQKEQIRTILENKAVVKIIHNAMFEIVTFLFHGVRVRNVFDTMLAEKVRYGGDQQTYGYSLEEICWRRLGVQLDKQYQTTFGDGQLDQPRIRYAAQDVSYLSILKKEIYQECQQFGLENTIALENEVVEAFAEMVYNGMKVDVDWWMNLQHEAEPLVAAAKKKLDEWLLDPKFNARALELGYISVRDRILINWNSGKQKKVIFDMLFPDLPGTTKAVLKKYVSDKIKAGEHYMEWLAYYIEGDTKPATDYLIEHHRDWLISQELLIPAGVSTVNWNSVAQVLPIIQCVERVADLSAESLGRTSHPIVPDYEDFKDTAKLISAFGEEWIHKNLEPDGKVRVSINQILNTGRISTSKPNMQQIPAKEAVGNKYRHAFIPELGWKFTSSDYVSQELIIIAELSRDPVWMEALSKGQDLHSIAAEMVFKGRWKEAAEKDCAYYQLDSKQQLGKQKCKCKKHKYMRNGVKTINFGLAYGMSEFKLASTLRISVPEAKQMIIDYFKAFPGIGALLDYLGKFGVQRGYIQTIKPFFRKRFFPYWHHYTRFIEGHIMKAQYHPGLGEIERASKNMPIQGTSADITKLALCMLYWEIFDGPELLVDKVRLIMQVHDQVDSNSKEDYAPVWAKKQTEIMEEAAKFIIPSGLLKAETTITSRWEK